MEMFWFTVDNQVVVELLVQIYRYESNANKCAH